MIIVSSVLNVENERTRRDCRRLKPNKQDEPHRTQTHHTANHTSWKIKYLRSTYIPQLLLFMATRHLLSTALCPLLLTDSQALGTPGLPAPANSNMLGGGGGWGGPPSHHGLGAERLSHQSQRYKCRAEALPLQALPLNSSLNMFPLYIWCNFSVRDKLTSEFGV